MRLSLEMFFAMWLVLGGIVILSFLWRMSKPNLFNARRRSHRGKPEKENDSIKLFHAIAIKNTCPDCGHQGFYAGPGGGLAQNITCANPHCRARFNVARFTADTGFVERIGKNK